MRTLCWPDWPRYDQGTIDRLTAVLGSGRWSISGHSTGEVCQERQFASAFAAYHQVNYCTPVSSGTAALILSLQALNIGFGSEVIIPGLTCVACALAVKSTGATPVPADIDPRTLSVSPAEVESKINCRTRAIIVVHPYCALADIEGFMKLSQIKNIPIIEDCAQAHGAEYMGKKVGTFGRVGCFSFQTSKTLTSGEGGAIITQDYELYCRIEQLRAHGRVFSRNSIRGMEELSERGNEVGQNYCLSEFHAAILLDRLPHLDEENILRRKNMTFLATALRDKPQIRLLYSIADISQPTYGFTIGFEDDVFRNRIPELRQLLYEHLGLVSHRLYIPLVSIPKRQTV